mmetsp:Transcript_3512/g.3554  ORF Transcript_3512/g.3554 Transcript_3512/m.3554 type:complete len:262 (-) Transcript_3512:31-816(-)
MKERILLHSCVIWHHTTSVAHQIRRRRVLGDGTLGTGGLSIHKWGRSLTKSSIVVNHQSPSGSSLEVRRLDLEDRTRLPRQHHDIPPRRLVERPNKARLAVVVCRRYQPTHEHRRFGSKDGASPQKGGRLHVPFSHRHLQCGAVLGVAKAGVSAGVQQEAENRRVPRVSGERQGAVPPAVDGVGRCSGGEQQSNDVRVPAAGRAVEGAASLRVHYRHVSVPCQEGGDTGGMPIPRGAEEGGGPAEALLWVIRVVASVKARV